MRYSRLILLFLWLGIGAGLSSAQPPSLRVASEGLPAPAKTVLSNGMTVLVTRIPTSPMVSVYALVKTGSAAEGKFLGTGVSHFLEHMLFKGTEKRGVGQIAAEVQALGGTINASTSFDYTIYTITVPAGAFDQALDIIADVLMHSRFDAEEINKEREVVFGEMRLYRDRPENRLHEMLFSTVYIKHPYGIPIIGYEELLRGLSREDFLEYYHSRYIPNNIVLSVAGMVSPAEAMPKIELAFRDFQRQRYPLRTLPQEPPQTTGRTMSEEYVTDLTRLAMAYAGVSVSDPDMFALDVLSMVLGRGDSSRLTRSLLKEKELVRSISASNFTPMDRGVFNISATLDKDRLEPAVRAIKEEIAKVQARGVSPAELEKAKRQVLAQYIAERQTSADLAYTAALDEAVAGDYEFSRKYVEAVRRVTAADIQRVAAEYLRDDRLTTVTLFPKEEKAENAPVQEQASVPEIERIVLSNGIVVLLREDHTFPLISMNVSARGGVAEDPKGLTGLSELTARVWVEGTASRTSRQIAEETESRAASVSGFSGRNSLGLRLDVLSEDLVFGLDLLEDLLKNPSFPEAEIRKAKDQVRTALLAKKDSVPQLTFQALRETLFQTHPMRLEPLGTFESVDKIARKDIQDFYSRWRNPSHMVISVFGDFDKKTVTGELSKRFGALSSTGAEPARHQEELPAALRESTVLLDKTQAIVAVGFHGPDVASPDRDGVDVLTAILGSSFNGRMFVRIRDELGQAYSLGGDYLPGWDKGMIYFYVLTTEENVDKVREVLFEMIREIRRNGVTEKELEDIKKHLQGTFQMSIETNAALNSMTTLDELYGLGYNHYLDQSQRIDRVGRDDVQRLAQQYLDPQRAAVVISRPAEKP